MNKITVKSILDFKKTKKKFATITAYDFCSAQIIDKAEVPLIFRNREYGETKLEFIEILKFLGTIGRLLLIGLQRGSGKTISSEWWQSGKNYN